MLKDGGKGDNRLALQPLKKNFTVTHTILGASGQDFTGGLVFRAAGMQSDLQPLVLVETLFYGSVVAGKLELVMPPQLQIDGFASVGIGCQQEGGGSHDYTQHQISHSRHGWNVGWRIFFWLKPTHTLPHFQTRGDGRKP